MKTINISKAKYNSLEDFKLPNDVMNTEAKMHILNYHENDYLFKDFYNHTGERFANKLFTVEMLDYYKDILPSNFVIPETLVSVANETSGFALPIINGINLEHYLANPKIDVKNKLFYIKRVGVLLEQLNHIRKNTELKDIYLNDLHASNFIIEERGDIKVVDLDSAKICGAKSQPARYLSPKSLLNNVKTGKYVFNNQEENKSALELMKENNKYNRYLSHVEANENSDLYCYTILFLNYIYEDNVGMLDLNTFLNYINYLEYLKYDRHLLNAIYKLTYNSDNENLYPYLDTLTDEQVYRANNKIYKLNKSKI